MDRRLLARLRRYSSEPDHDPGLIETWLQARERPVKAGLWIFRVQPVKEQDRLDLLVLREAGEQLFAVFCAGDR
jgi:hypothetical protein